MTTVMIAEELYIQSCCDCAVRFAVTAYFDKERRKDKRSFYCPNGHPQSYREGEADLLRRERDLLKQDAARLQDEIAAERTARLSAERREAKLKKRSANGVCPCCTRSFQNLRRHIATKHPDFSDNVVPLKAEATS